MIRYSITGMKAKYMYVKIDRFHIIWCIRGPVHQFKVYSRVIYLHHNGDIFTGKKMKHYFNNEIVFPPSRV